MPLLSFIPPQFIKTGQAGRDDLDQFVVCGIHLAEGSSAGKARAWKVNPDNTSAGEIAIPSEGGKVDSVAARVLRDGRVRFVVSQANAPNASGSTAQPFVYYVPSVFPPASDPAGGGDGSLYVEAPHGAIRILNIEGTGYTGKQTIALGPLGIPAGVQLLNVRVCASAEAAKRRGRCGPGENTAGHVTVETQLSGVRMYAMGMVPAGPNNTLIVLADSGALREFYVDVLGWQY